MRANVHERERNAGNTKLGTRNTDAREREVSDGSAVKARTVGPLSTSQSKNSVSALKTFGGLGGGKTPLGGCLAPKRRTGGQSGTTQQRR